MKFRWNIDNHFENSLLYWASQFPYCAWFNPNGWQKDYPKGSFPKMLAVATQKESYSFLEVVDAQKWLIGYLGYDLKNQLENLTSQNPYFLDFDDFLCFEPQFLFIWLDDYTLEVHTQEPLLQDSVLQVNPLPPQTVLGELQSRVSFEQYCKQVEKIKQHIVEGDVYELNYCIEFFAENTQIDPLQTYLSLCQHSPMPFSVFLKSNHLYALCASPERFLKKTGNQLISQPIKGTIPRGQTPQEDALQKEKLRHNEKEMAENMMIVDLVRNDLARGATIGSTQVTEMFGIYTFRQLHQMISTIEAQLHPQKSIADILRYTFPMGSMTGAPKIKAMELIEYYENTRRGLFSGAIGFINPEGDFDLNVVIRTIFYDAQKKYLSFQVGSAITYDAVAEQEYQECLLKARAIKEVLGF
jgi:para-aminobenzoate synthetase component 1